MKTVRNIFYATVASMLLPAYVLAQPVDYRTDRVTGRSYNEDAYGPRAGDWEVTLGGGGSNDRHFRGGGFNVNSSLGYFLSENWEVAVRQGIAWSDFGESIWSGSTRGAVDYHFNLDRFRPFVGLNFGGMYGRHTVDTWAAGLEAGFKFYVQPRTFIFVMAEYDWLFKNVRNVDDTFSDGQFIYSLGLGFHF